MRQTTGAHVHIAFLPDDNLEVVPGSHVRWDTPPPTCFLRPGALDDLTPRAQTLFKKFIQTYQDNWLKGEYGD